ncbi:MULTISPECIES: DUF4145 domain-containing protein [unclassified Bradyrhizobium]|uniref:DUF4145 domain-containing protein n=1 Tax=unclassified Bradyrhizobium TaxID=2631580 RepID=UPI0028F0885A|nr:MULTISPECIES: DUF4145 domain-containing protein [unclassified Bradyrhizobium]
MDWKQFFASVIGALAWPAATVIIVLVFREQLRLIVRHIRKFGAGPLNVELSEKLEQVEAAGAALQSEQGVEAPDPSLDPATLELVKSAPDMAFIKSFKQLEQLLLEIRTKLPDGKPYRNLYEVLRALEKQQYIPASVIALFQTLREARNAAAHGTASDALSSADALEFIRQIKLLQGILETVSGQLSAQPKRIADRRI